ncbi:MAG: hypothetical protein COB59_09205 [Rhodospirillaceae bacterium]|nr:MAG: hypothetical protein COB59_09205 [Rhodospirillaceae bacterium]
MAGEQRDSEKRLQAAELRLANAIVRLETALKNQSPAEANAAGADENLAAELSRLQTENLELKGLAQQTSTRLDVTIAQLKDHMVATTKGQV